MKAIPNTRTGALLGGLALLLAMASASARADSLVVDVTGIASRDLLGSSANTVLSFNIGAGSHVTGLSWDVTLQALAPSWLSEMQLSFSGSDASGPGVLFTPGLGSDQSGSAQFSGQSSWTAQGLDFRVGTDGVLRLEFSEAAADGLTPDGIWKSGHLHLDYAAAVPEPASYGLMGLGLLLLLGLQQRQARKD
ncbi:hypothetical protein HNP55_002997 [Paucibacter oligotrophus]|uniref:Ice-binding protein C-terminal domain-containing protein n=1 Tax=Roseateles oligotrophus TaxID=1769250 RepID=A0A840LCP1_9BURK|nr:PEP-CTERM sorting domain-containing protein [Roseateles oligotrophus]MBB4844453.1 hypothetical protein [Roseateles oligotrophus]